MHRWIVGVCMGVISLVLVVGCGGGDSSTAADGGDSTTITKVEFTKQADAVCASGKDARTAIFADYSKDVKAASNGKADPSLERKLANEMIDESLIPSMTAQLEEMEELGSPAADEAKVADMTKALSLGIEDLEKDGVQALVGGTNLGAFQKAAQAYGLNCPL